MNAGRRALAQIVAVHALGTALVMAGLVLLDLVWLGVLVMAVAWGWLVVPVIRMTVALQEVYGLADMADSRDEGIPPGVAAVAVEKAVGLSSRYRRNAWADSRRARTEEGKS